MKCETMMKLLQYGSNSLKEIMMWLNSFDVTPKSANLSSHSFSLFSVQFFLGYFLLRKNFSPSSKVFMRFNIHFVLVHNLGFYGSQLSFHCSLIKHVAIFYGPQSTLGTTRIEKVKSRREKRGQEWMECECKFTPFNTTKAKHFISKKR
jgi:hypothetical protein